MSLLLEQYDKICEQAIKAVESITQKLTNLALELDIPLAYPISGRVKTWESIESKLKRLPKLKLNSISELEDIVGVRAVFLFKSDVVKFGENVQLDFTVKNVRLSIDRNSVDRFGYGSDHFVLCLEEHLLAELQVRTLSQHVWAEASHRLYYKNEQMVPKELQRSIHRTAAVLEVVDFELERLRKERDDYIRVHRTFPGFEDYEGLSIMGVQLVLDDMLPEDHFVEDDHYFGLMTELLHLGVNTLGALRTLIRENLVFALEEEQKVMALMLKDPQVDEGTKKHIRKTRRWCSQVALVRTILIHKFKEQYRVCDPDKWK